MSQGGLGPEASELMSFTTIDRGVLAVNH